MAQIYSLYNRITTTHQPTNPMLEGGEESRKGDGIRGNCEREGIAKEMVLEGIAKERELQRRRESGEGIKGNCERE